MADIRTKTWTNTGTTNIIAEPMDMTGSPDIYEYCTPVETSPKFIYTIVDTNGEEKKFVYREGEWKPVDEAIPKNPIKYPDKEGICGSCGKELISGKECIDCFMKYK